jgi:U5 small nuclear ribonucleoprotein component
MDRLITELKLPPADAYHKIAFTIEEVNTVIRAAGGGGGDSSSSHSAPNGAANGVGAANGASAVRISAAGTPLLDPVAGNVAFASGYYGYSFTLRSFAALYKAVCGDAPKDVLLVDAFASRLWGDVWYYPEERVFKRKPPTLGAAACCARDGAAGSRACAWASRRQRARAGAEARASHRAHLPGTPHAAPLTRAGAPARRC